MKIILNQIMNITISRSSITNYVGKQNSNYKNLLKILVSFYLNPLQAYYWHKYNDQLFENQEFHLTEEAKGIFILSYYIVLWFTQ